MSEASFDALAEALVALRWDMDLREATELAPNVTASLRSAAQWARKFEIAAGWFKTDYAALAAPSLSPPPARITEVIERCKSNGETSRYGGTYIDLVLRWSWAEDEIGLDGLSPPYEGIRGVLLAGAGLSGEHGFIGPGAASLRIGSPADHF